MILEKFNYLEYFKSDLLKLKMAGGWINYDFKVLKFYKVYFYFINFLFIFLFNSLLIMYWILNSNSIKSFAALGYILMVCLMGQVKSFFIYMYGDHFKNLIIQMKEKLFQPNNNDEKCIVRQNLKLYWNIKTALASVSFISTLCAVTVPLVYQKGDGLPTSAWYPVNISTTPLFQIAYIHQAVSIFYIALINTYTDLIVAGFFTFTGLQCDILCARLQKLGKQTETENHKYLGVCVQHHWCILKFAQTTEKIFGKIYFGQIIASTIALCMDMFLLTLTEPKTFEFFYLVVYQIAIANLIFVPCWFATEMTRKIIRSSLSYYAVLNNLNMAEEELTE